MEPLRLIFDMETQDPDDVLTLCLIATHPNVDLRAVTVFPGGKDQVGVVRHILTRLGRQSVPVGAGQPKKVAARVSEFHYRWLGKIEPAEADAPAAEVILEAIRHGAADLLTGAPLTNVHSALQQHAGGRFLWTWTCQGGFAGDNVVPPEHRLPKFNGRETCPTFNLNGDVEAARTLIQTERIRYKKFVTKNVCHGVFYDRAMHDRLPSGAHAGLDLLKEGMEVYFQRQPDGKALHDTIAAALAICPWAATWVEGKIFRRKGEWGTAPRIDDDPWGNVQWDSITIALDREKFERALWSPCR